MLRQAPDPGELALYPDALQAGRLSLPLSYRFSPGDAADGVTLKLPASALAGLNPEALERAVPGLLRERVTALLKALPREVRRHLVPLPQSAAIILRDIEKSKGPLPAALSESLRRRFRLDVPPSAWDLEGLPEHLRLRYAVVDARGRELRSTRDIESLQRDRLEEQASRAFHRAKAAWERTGVTRWEAPGLPEEIPAEIPLDPHNVLEGVAYPALVSTGDAVDLRLLRDRGEAEAAHRAGVRTLLALQFRKELAALRRCLSLRGEMKVWSVYFGGAAALEDILHRGLIRRLLEKDIRTRRDFDDYVRSLGPVLLQTPLQLLAQVEPVLRAYHETRQALSALEAANRTNRSVVGFLGEMRAELDRIVPVSFLERYGPERLSQLPRYLKALQIRAERGTVHLDRDRVRAAEIRPYEEKLDELLKAPRASPEKARAIDEYRWMVEEYRVSVFAQEIRTPYPVSPKRLNAKLREIEDRA